MAIKENKKDYLVCLEISECNFAPKGRLNDMKKWGKLKAVALYILFFLMLDIFISSIPGVTYIDQETGESVIHGFPALVCIIGPFIITYVIVKRHNEGKPLLKKSASKKVPTSEDDIDIKCNETSQSEEQAELIKVPFSKKAREKLAEDLLFDVKLNVDLANKTPYISNFLEYYDSALLGLKKLKQLDGKVKFNGSSPAMDYYRLTDELQWHLCDAIERAKDLALDEIQGKFRNSIEYQQRRANLFLYDIEDCRNRFSHSTAEFADKALIHVLNAVGMNYQIREETAIKNQHPTSGLAVIDTMEGHDFEYWCADLLRKTGFQNVEVTPGSGDQGVDILAEKSGIKYAIQCKCYSKDLGNTPIQEVEAGRIFYGCHVGVVITNRYFTKGAKTLAEKTGTLLWDRDYIETAIK